MRKIVKSEAPPALIKWAKQNPHQQYSNVDDQVRQSIRTACIKEQYYLCAYCCDEITDQKNSCHNEHIEPQKQANTRTLDFFNIIASCNAKNQCGHSHGHANLELTPLMIECETELQFELNGLVNGKTPRAQSCIKTLNLGDTVQSNRKLVEKRKQIVEALLYSNGVNPFEKLEDDELLELVIADLNTPDTESDTSRNLVLKPFSPVLVNILQSWLKQ